MRITPWTGIVRVAAAFGILTLSTSAFAGGCKVSPKSNAALAKRIAELEKQLKAIAARPEWIPACSDPGLDRSRASSGSQCRTSRGTVFERVERSGFGPGWRGPDGLIWGDPLSSKLVHEEAVLACARVGGKLANREEFLRSERDGFREALPDMKQGRLWTSSPHPNDAGYSLVFDYLPGRVVIADDDTSPQYPIDVDRKNNSNSVRCVTR